MVDGKIYAIGGASILTTPVGLSTVEVYDPATDIGKIRICGVKMEAGCHSKIRVFFSF